MKNVFKQIGIIALAAVIGFSFAACGGGGNGGGYGDDIPEYGGGTPQPPGGQPPGGGSGLGPNNEVPGDTLTAQLEWLKSNVQSDTSYTLTARADETISTSARLLNYTDKSNITITLTSSGGEKIISSGGTGNWFTVGNGVTLILDENITLQGGTIGVYLEPDGTFIMNGGTISGNNSYGVSVNSSSGTFTMNGGTISGNGTGVSSRGEFIMNGGTISGNEHDGAAGDGKFTMNGGIISGNNGCGVSSGGEFIMNDGTISDNTSRGVLVSRNSFTMNGGTISGNDSGVFLSGGNFTMNGGTISGNTSTGNGGGVYVRSDGGAFTMNGGEISGNTAIRGGGVYSDSNSRGVYISNGIIYGSDAESGKANIATDDSYGGSAALYSSKSAFYGYGNYYDNPLSWNDIPMTYSWYFRNTTINVVNGELQ